MIFQNNKLLIKPIQKWGCNFLSYAAICEREMGVNIAPKTVNQFYYDNQGSSLNDKCGVLSPDKLMNAIFKMYGCDYSGHHIGNKDQILSYVKNRRTDATVICYKTDYTGDGYGKHYMAGDKDAVVFFDPAAGMLEIRQRINYLRIRIDK